MQKALTKMNVQLANVISDITGVSGDRVAIRKAWAPPWFLFQKPAESNRHRASTLKMP
jgi:hypothetical protein